MKTASSGRVLGELAKGFDRNRFLTLNETLSFAQYLDRIVEQPMLCMSAYQRIFDMIVSKGVEKFKRYNKTHKRYKFFSEHPQHPVFGLEEAIEQLVGNIKGAAGYFGTEKRVLLLHGPVGSSKSTICRAIKRGLEAYTQTDRGALYTFDWVKLPKGMDLRDRSPCPMHDDPIKLVPSYMRRELEDQLNSRLSEMRLADGDSKETKALDQELHAIFRIVIRGELNPHDQFFFDALLKEYNGDWLKMVSEHIEVRRIALNEGRRIGIGTFQPKDEKNQDATELTGDVNYMKLGQYGADSDPRAFNFDGEFMVANRGLLEMIEMLKLNQEFLYDILGATQEQQVKPKKFPQVAIDVAIFGHSVHGDTPVPHEYDGVLDVLPIEKMRALDPSKLRVFSVNVQTRQMELSGVRSVFSHQFKGEWVQNHQAGDTLVTTPNHSVYNENYEMFYPGDDETSPILTLAIPDELVNGKPTTERWSEFFAEALVA